MSCSTGILGSVTEACIGFSSLLLSMGSLFCRPYPLSVLLPSRSMTPWDRRMAFRGMPAESGRGLQSCAGVELPRVYGLNVTLPCMSWGGSVGVGVIWTLQFGLGLVVSFSRCLLSALGS
uniref:Uncharacterized protein n=1 Tax=Xenopus tropicalis TaxID=8364 RepID=A0A1B8XTQ3_XENTR